MYNFPVLNRYTGDWSSQYLINGHPGLVLFFLYTSISYLFTKHTAFPRLQIKENQQ